MDLLTNYEAQGQLRLFSDRHCRRILFPGPGSQTQPVVESAAPGSRGVAQSVAWGRQPYALKLHRAQKHHLDLRLCFHWIALSWALYSLPSHSAEQSCIAIEVEDHLREYITFEGVHPDGEGKRGAGPTIVVDEGSWQPLPERLDIREALRFGCLRFHIEGQLLRGIWSLIRRKECYLQDNPRWVLTKEMDVYAGQAGAAEGLDWTKLRSCRSHRTLEEVESDWHLGIRRFRGDGSLFAS